MTMAIGKPSWVIGMEVLDQMLGMATMDRVTGLKGVITSVSLDLDGRVQALLTPRAKGGVELVTAVWVDVHRMEVTGTESVVELPSFATDGEEG